MKNITIFSVTLLVFCTFASATDTESQQLRNEIRLLKERLTELEERLDVPPENHLFSDKNSEEKTEGLQSLAFEFELPSNDIVSNIGWMNGGPFGFLDSFAVLKEINDYLVIDGILIFWDIIPISILQLVAEYPRTPRTLLLTK